MTQSPSPQAPSPSLSRLEQLHDYTYRKVAGVLGECQSPLEPINLSVGEPDQPAPALVRAAAVTKVESGDVRYTPAAGAPSLRKAIADHITETA